MERSRDTLFFTPEFGKRPRDLRLKAGLTQLELQRAVGREGAGSPRRRSQFVRSGDSSFHINSRSDLAERRCAAGIVHRLSTTRAL
jgi:hypothetical protein